MTANEMKTRFDEAALGYWYLDLGLRETYSIIFGISIWTQRHFKI